jgi:hypothetical protein
VFEVYCSGHGTWVLLDASRIEAIRNTGDGPVIELVALARRLTVPDSVGRGSAQRRSSKKPVIRAVASSDRTPGTTSTSWFSRGSTHRL